MVIGIDASRANKDHKSGTEWYSYYLIRWLAKLDKENQYILYTDKPLSGGLVSLGTLQHYTKDERHEEPNYDKNGYQVLDSPFGNFKGKVLKWPFLYFWTLGRLSIEMLRKRPDILFIPAHTLPLFHPRRTIITIHDIGFTRDAHLYRKEAMGPESQGGKRLLSFLVAMFTGGKYRADSIDYLKWSTEYALKHASKIITVSQFSKNEILDFYKRKADERKIVVIHNGYNTSLFKKIDDQQGIAAVLDKYGLPAPYLLYVGRIEKKKNISAMIEAFAIMKENNKQVMHKMVLIGDAGFGYDEIKYMIREFDLVNDIIMPGWVEEVDMPYIFCGASAFVFPSQYEGFGIPLLQAMACGIPIAASQATSIPEVVGDAALLFNPNYILSISEALEKIIVDKSFREELVKRGSQRIDDFSWCKCAQQTLTAITEIK